MIRTYDELKKAIENIPGYLECNVKYGIIIKENTLNFVKLDVGNILADKGYKVFFNSYTGNVVSDANKYQLNTITVNTITVKCDKSDIHKAFEDIETAISQTDLACIPCSIDFDDGIDEVLNKYSKDPDNYDLYHYNFAGDVMLKYENGRFTVKYSAKIYQ